MAKVGISFITPAPQVQPEFVIQMAKKIEQTGLDSFWVNDRIAYDNLESLAVLSAAAAVTNKISLGTSILLSTLRHPALLAKTLATIDFLSRGRVIAGIGVGNRVSDYEAVQVPFEHRGGRSLESVQLMRRLWTGSEVPFDGEFFSMPGLSIGPRPFGNRSIPIWMGGTADPVLKRAAEYADGYICATSALSNFPAIWGKISQYARARGRDPDKIEKAGLNFIAIDEDRSRAIAACNAYFERYYGKAPQNAESHMIIGPAPACADRLALLLESGVGHLILGLIVADLGQIDLLAEQVLPHIQQLRRQS